MQAPGAGAGKVALASWVLSLSDVQERPLRCSSSSAQQRPLALPLRPRDGASAHWPVISLVLASLGPLFHILRWDRDQRDRTEGGKEGPV